MTARKVWRLVAITALVALVAAACGDDDSGDDATDTDTEAPSSADASELDLVAAGALTVCTDAPYEPFEFEDDDGEFTGFDMEILRAVIAPAGLDLAVTVQPFDGIWLAPDAGTCDLVGSAMTITPERAENALFSDPYFDADQSLLVRAADVDTFADLADLEGARIGVQTGTTGADYAVENAPEGAEIVEFDEPGALFLALESEDIDAILQDLPVNGFRSTQDDQFALTDTFPTGEEYGFAVALDNESLIDFVNTRLAEMRDDGSYDGIYAEWFGD